MAVLVVSAHAAQTSWVDVKPVRYRLVAAQVDGQAYAALQIQLKPAWHTYWRYPGASGIAPEFSFTGSDNIDVGKAIFPAPFFFDDGVGGFYGYEMMTGFAFPLDVNGDGTLNFTGLIGVCREVCVPLDMKRTLKIDTGKLAASEHKQVVTEILRAQAEKPSADLMISSATFDGVSLQLVVSGENLVNPRVMSVPGPHDVLGPPRIVARHPASYLIEIPAWSKLDHPLIGRKLSFVVRHGMRAIEQEITVRDHRLLTQNEPRLTK